MMMCFKNEPIPSFKHKILSELTYSRSLDLESREIAEMTGLNVGPELETVEIGHCDRYSPAFRTKTLLGVYSCTDISS
jgi:hypothetical protein